MLFCCVLLYLVLCGFQIDTRLCNVSSMRFGNAALAEALEQRARGRPLSTGLAETVNLVYLSLRRAKAGTFPLSCLGDA